MSRVFLLGTALLLCCGCSPVAQEPDQLALVRVLGVDGASPVELMAVCGGDNSQQIERGACVGDTFGHALECLPWTAQKQLSLTSVSFVIVGPDTDLVAVLYGVLEDEEIGGGATVWAAESAAAQMLEACRDPASQLQLLLERGVEAPTAARVLGELVTRGQVLLPLLGQAEGKPVLRGEVLWKSAR